MNIQVDDSQLRNFDRRLAQAGRAFDANVTGRTLRDSMKPMLDASKREAPTGGGGKYGQKVSLRYRGNSNANDYRRNGATRQDQRIKIVRGSGEELVKGLVGTSKKRGKVGWRTHFITLGTKAMRANDFLTRAYNATINDVVSGFGASAAKIVQRILR